MRKHRIVVLAIGFLLLVACPLTLYAKKAEPIAINNIVLDDITIIGRQTLKNGNLVLRLAAPGVGTIDGTEVAIQQGFGIIARINIDHTSAGIKGRTAGSLVGPMFPGGWEFMGTVKGTATCPAEGLCDLSMIVRASSKNGGELGMVLSGTFNRTTGEFGDLTGSGLIKKIGIGN